ncbi:30S ribosomal protein S16 [bacterium]|nr:MAG: 30S ribosomal protein S16 [bacterium]
MGRKKRPFYRLVALDSRKRRDGAYLANLGYYNPFNDPHEVELHTDEIVAWLGKGATLSETARSLLKAEGVMYRYSLVKQGLDAAEVERLMDEWAAKSAARKEGAAAAASAKVEAKRNERIKREEDAKAKVAEEAAAAAKAAEEEAAAKAAEEAAAKAAEEAAEEEAAKAAEEAPAEAAAEEAPAEAAAEEAPAEAAAEEAPAEAAPEEAPAKAAPEEAPAKAATEEAPAGGSKKKGADEEGSS